MFVELMPLLAGRTVMITVAREDEKTVRVCVIPKKVKEDDNPALTTPLSYTGTPEELDAELGKHLASYVECHTQLGSTLAQAKAEMEAASSHGPGWLLSSCLYLPYAARLGAGGQDFVSR